MKTRSEGRLLRVTLDRVAKRNALNFETCEQLVAVFEAAATDPGVGAILLDGEGPVFCAGMDLEEALREEADERLRIHAALFTVGLRLTKPVVAAVHGACLGGGVGLAAAAHVVVAADNCRFALTEIRLGLWPFAIWRAIEGAFGERRALELSLTGRSFAAAEAERWGLVHMVTPECDLQSRSTELAMQLAEASPVAIENGLKLVHGCRDASLDDALALALQLRTGTLRSPDFHEGVAAWREKRAPRWPSIYGARSRRA